MPNRLVLALSNILSRWTRNINRSKNQCQPLTGYGDDNVKMLGIPNVFYYGFCTYIFVVLSTIIIGQC